MKKILCLLICLFLITGCGNKEVETLVDIDTTKVATELKKFSYFSDEKSLNDTDLIAGYGIDTEIISDYAIYLSSAVNDPSMYIVAKPKEGKTSVLKFQIKDMLSKYQSSYAGYYPESVPMIENHLEKEYNGYLIYIVSNENETVYNKILECKK